MKLNASNGTDFARRLVAFMPGGITFTCRCCRGLDERWQKSDLHTTTARDGDPNSTNDWLWLLELYADRIISFREDRIPGIMGIVSEMGKRRSDKFISELGVWEKDLGNS